MAGKREFAKNVEVLAYHDLDGRPGFQMAMQEVEGRYYLYCSHFKASGWAILDVTEPARPEYVKFIPGPQLSGQTTPKLQVADGIMITALGGSLPMLHGTGLTIRTRRESTSGTSKTRSTPRGSAHWDTGGDSASIVSTTVVGGTCI